MKIYFAGSYTRRELDILADYHCPIMQNWSTVDRNDPLWKKLKTGEIDDVIFDSGGFQVQTGTRGMRGIGTGSVIDRSAYADRYSGKKWAPAGNPVKWILSTSIDTYALWLELTLQDYPNIKYMCLDVPRNNAKTLDNLAYLESCGLSPIPIWHATGSEVYDTILDYYCDRYEYIAIGGIALGNRRHTFNLFSYLMQKYPHMKFHLLGIGLGLSNICRIYRPYSADASSWLAPARWGSELIFDGKNIKLRGMSPEDRLAIRKNDDVRTEWSLKTIQRLKEFEKVMNNTLPTEPVQANLFTGEEN